MQDGAPPHRSESTLDYLENEKCVPFKWLATTVTRFKYNKKSMGTFEKEGARKISKEFQWIVELCTGGMEQYPQWGHPEFICVNCKTAESFKKKSWSPFQILVSGLDLNLCLINLVIKFLCPHGFSLW